MNFDVVIGNPPYQEPSGRASIYTLFMRLAINVGNTVSMITRNNWLNGMAFKQIRNELKDSGCINTIVDFPTIGDVFTNVQVAVAYFVWTRGNRGGQTHYIRKINGEVVNDTYVNIGESIIIKSAKDKIIVDKITGPFWCEKYETLSYPFMDQRKRYELESSIFEDEYFNVRVVSNNDIDVYVNKHNFENNAYIDYYKVMCGVIINEANRIKPGNVLTNIMTLKPDEVSSETWSILAKFDNEIECKNCEKYIKTRFVRWLANQSVDNRSNVTKNTMQIVPIQDFTSNSDINWSKSINEIDYQLCTKYGLTEDEMRYIATTIKPMA